jgi:glutathione synthase
MVEDNERNVLDQKLIESELFRKYRIHSMRCNFDCIKVCGKVDPVTQVLTVMGKEIAFVYYRTGYQEDHYIDLTGSDHKWEARELLECSMAIKCPSIDFQLTTFKKYQ